MTWLLEGVRWIVDPVNWSGFNAIQVRLWEHVWYSGSALLVAVAIAVPAGLLVGHTGRGAVVAVNIGNLGRAIPDLGIVALLAVLIGFGVIPVLIALTALAIPPLLTNTFTGVRGIDPDVREAAEGLGFTGWELLRRIELPLALPLVFAGLRTSTVQVIATATIAGFIGQAGGLGRYIFDGLALNDTPRVVGGAILCAVLAVVAEAGLSRAQRRLVPRGLADRGRHEDQAPDREGDRTVDVRSSSAPRGMPASTEPT